MRRITEEPVKNFTTFRAPAPDAPPFEVIQDKEGVETGIRLKGTLTTFEKVNENGQTWMQTAYDDGVASYFAENNLSVPLDLMHQRDLMHLAGRVEVLRKTENGVELEAIVPKGVYFYNLIKTLLTNGILQGFSNYGYVTRGEVDDDEILHVEAFQLISASLVDVPADTGARFLQNVTRLEGFGEHLMEVTPSDKVTITALPLFMY